MKNISKIFLAPTLLLGFLFVSSTFDKENKENMESAHAKQAEGGDALVGVWEPGHGKAKIKISKIGSKYFGKIVWLREPLDEDGERKTDDNNPDPKMHDTPLLGYKILKDFEYVGEDTWENGTIYDPENGSIYNCTITMKDKNTLDVRGYIGVSMIGRTDTWKRLTKKK